MSISFARSHIANNTHLADIKTLNVQTQLEKFINAYSQNMLGNTMDQKAAMKDIIRNKSK